MMRTAAARLRIALVFPNCSKRGGVERVMWEAARHLSARHDVFVVASTFTSPLEKVSWRQVRQSQFHGPMSAVQFRFAARRVLNDLRPDLTISYGGECPPGDLLVVGSVHRAWLARSGRPTLGLRRLPTWTRFLSPGNIALLLLERSYFGSGKIKAFAPCAKQVVDDLAKYYHVSPSRNTVVNNGFDPSVFSPERRARQRLAARAGLGFLPSDFVLVMVANEWQRKGLRVLLEALALLRDPSLRLVLVGRRAPDAFTSLVDRLELGSAFTYVGPTDNVAWYHACADVFVLPTQYEAFPLAIVEALASGLPVLTTTVPGAADLVRPGINGLLLADPSDAQGLAEMIRTVMVPETLARLSGGARPSVDHLTWDTLMERFETLVEGVASAGS